MEKKADLCMGEEEEEEEESLFKAGRRRRRRGAREDSESEESESLDLRKERARGYYQAGPGLRSSFRVSLALLAP